MNNKIDIIRHGMCGGEVKSTNAEIPELFCLKCGRKVKDYEVVIFYKEPALNNADVGSWWKFW